MLGGMAVPRTVHAHPEPTAARGQQRAVRRGALVAVAHGVFADRDGWQAATEWEQHIARTVAAQQRSPRTIVSHASAVVLHRLPWISPVPTRPTLTDPDRTTTQRTRSVDKAPGVGRALRPVLVEGVPVTDLVVTAIDVVLRHDRGRALSVADAVVRRGTDPAALRAELERRGPVRAHRRAAQVLRLAAGLSESAGESITLLALDDLGCGPVVQQQEFHDDVGLIGRADFWLPEHGVVVEFDGLAKYRDPSLRRGRSAEEVVVAEKLREDRLRARSEVRAVVRPTWRDVSPDGRFPSMLAGAGVPVRRGVVRTPAW